MGPVKFEAADCWGMSGLCRKIAVAAASARTREPSTLNSARIPSWHRENRSIAADGRVAGRHLCSRQRRARIDRYQPAAGRQRRSCNAFAITITLDNDIAAPANIGLRSPEAASRIPITL